MKLDIYWTIKTVLFIYLSLTPIHINYLIWQKGSVFQQVLSWESNLLLVCISNGLICVRSTVELTNASADYFLTKLKATDLHSVDMTTLLWRLWRQEEVSNQLAIKLVLERSQVFNDTSFLHITPKFKLQKGLANKLLFPHSILLYFFD